jgi:hypothetical protein
MALDETIPFPCGADEKEEEKERRYETKQQSSDGSRCLCILMKNRFDFLIFIKPKMDPRNALHEKPSSSIILNIVLL